MDRSGWIVSDMAFAVDWDGLELSITTTVTLKVPAPVGVPETVPSEDSDNPPGIPDETDQVYGGVPDVAARVCE
jgi:hypothetical protein